MATQYFTDCRTLDACGTLIRQLAQKHHPDRGGDLRTMQDIAEQYNAIKKWAKTYPTNWYDLYTQKFPANGAQPNTPPPSSARDARDEARDAEVEAEWEKLWYETLVELGLIDGISVEVCGDWIWVGGNTYPVKDQLYDLGLNWSRSKQMWYFAGLHSKGKGTQRGMKMSDIRAKYGSTKIKDE